MKVKEEIQRLLKVGFIKLARYMKWLSNINLVVKKNEKHRVYVEFRKLNSTTSKDKYSMPIVDILIDGVARHQYLSFMDGYLGYNKISIIEKDVAKATFRCTSVIGTYEWLVMPFGLKTASATYQQGNEYNI